MTNFEPVKISIPGQPGFKITVHQDAKIITYDGQMLDVKAGDQVEWDGKKLVVKTDGAPNV